MAATQATGCPKLDCRKFPPAGWMCLPHPARPNRGEGPARTAVKLALRAQLALYRYGMTAPVGLVPCGTSRIFAASPSRARSRDHGGPAGTLGHSRRSETAKGRRGRCGRCRSVGLHRRSGERADRRSGTSSACDPSVAKGITKRDPPIMARGARPNHCRGGAKRHPLATLMPRPMTARGERPQVRPVFDTTSI